LDEIHDNALAPNNTHAKKRYFDPSTALEKDFAAMDKNGDQVLSSEELMFRQYASGCEPSEAAVRGNDYMKCGDANHDDVISLQEFAASAEPAWAECVKESQLRRAHGFVKFFQSDLNYDNKLSPTELTVGLIKLWGPAGELLTQPLLKCTDKDKDGFLNQDEFHNSIFAYNPATRTWVMWSGTSDPSILTCMKGAFKSFDAALVFHATDTNKDGRLSQQELYDTVSATNSATIDHKIVNDIIKAADKDKNGWLSVEEFEGAGEAYKGKDEVNFYLSGRDAADLKASKSPGDTYDEGYGMSVKCYTRQGKEWRVYSDDLGKVKVTPTDDKGSVKVTGDMSGSRPSAP
jgi:Ca2+-binding EF-hand superfamily protein